MYLHSDDLIEPLHEAKTAELKALVAARSSAKRRRAASRAGSNRKRDALTPVPTEHLVRTN